MAQQVFDVCIRGAGIVGRSLALLLAQQRLRVGLVQAHTQGLSKTDVRAYALNTASRELFQSLRAWPEEGRATAVHAMRIFGDDGGLVNFESQPATVASTRPNRSAQTPATAPAQPETSLADAAQTAAATGGADLATTPLPAAAPALAWIVDVAALETALDQAIRFQPCIEWLNAPTGADLTVVCEGRASSTLAQWGVETDLYPYAQQAIAARLQCGIAHGGQAFQWFCGGEILAFLPLDGPQGNSVAIVWSVSEERAGELCAMDEQAFTAAVQAAGHAALGPMRLISERAHWPLQLGLAKRWTGQGARLTALRATASEQAVGPSSAPAHATARSSAQSWVLAGDAAHTVHPLAGQGLNLGLADVMELAKVLREREYWRSVGDPRLLRQYERSRRAALAPASMVMDGIHRLFAQPHARLQMLRNAGMWGFENSGPLKTWVAQQAMGLKT